MSAFAIWLMVAVVKTSAQDSISWQMVPVDPRWCWDRPAEGTGEFVPHGSVSAWPGCPTPAGVPPASIGLRVLAPAFVNAGEAFLVHLRAYNQSPVSVYQVELRCRLDARAEIVSTSPQAEQRPAQLIWRWDQLRPGEVRSLAVRLRATGDTPVRLCARIRYEHGVCVETRIRPGSGPPDQAQLELRKEGPSQLPLGTIAWFRLVVLNRGPAAAEEVVVVDELPEGLQHPDGGQRLSLVLGRLDPGQQRVLEYRVVARQAGQWTNRAMLRARGGLTAFASQTITVAEPKITLRLEAPSQLYSGATLPVRITLTNSGELPLRQVSVDYTVPRGAAVVETQPQASVIADRVHWSISQLLPQQQTTLTLHLRPGRSGTIHHTAIARAGGQSATARAQTEVIGTAGLLLVVVDTDDPVLVGQETRYYLIVRNQGTAPATNIRLRVQVPEQLAITRVQGPSDHQRQGQILIFEPLHLPPNTDRIYRITVRARQADVVRLRVEMTADQLPAGPVKAEESTTILDSSGS